MMKTAFEEIDSSDFLIIELTTKSTAEFKNSLQQKLYQRTKPYQNYFDTEM